MKHVYDDYRHSFCTQCGVTAEMVQDGQVSEQCRGAEYVLGIDPATKPDATVVAANPITIREAMNRAWSPMAKAASSHRRYTSEEAYDYACRKLGRLIARDATGDDVIGMLCAEIERLRNGAKITNANRLWTETDLDEARGQIEHLDRENARLRRELADARKVAQQFADSAALAAYGRSVTAPMDNVTRIAPFPDVQPARDESWPPPSHRPRMLP